jgi:hypothetical protein
MCTAQVRSRPLSEGLVRTLVEREFLINVCELMAEKAQEQKGVEL